MARKKPGQKKPAPQPAQEASDQLLEELLGELSHTDSLEAGGPEMERTASAPELLEALSATAEAPAPAVDPPTPSEPEQEMPEVLAAMQSAFVEQDTEQETFVSLSEAPLPEPPTASPQAELPELLPEPQPVPHVAAHEQFSEEAQSILLTPLEELPQSDGFELQPLDDIASAPLAEETQEAEAREQKPVTAEHSLSRRNLVSPGEEEEAREGQPDILSRVVAGIDTQIAANPAWENAGAELSGEEEAVEAYASFRLSGSAFAVPVGAIREIDRATEITPVPNVPPFIRGVINLRGDVTCVLDMRCFIGLSPLDDHEPGWLLVVSGAETRRSLALLVDEVSSLVRISASKVKPPTGKVEDRVIPLLKGVVEQRERVLGVLSVDSLLGSPDVRELWM